MVKMGKVKRQRGKMVKRGEVEEGNLCGQIKMERRNITQLYKY